MGRVEVLCLKVGGEGHSRKGKGIPKGNFSGCRRACGKGSKRVNIFGNIIPEEFLAEKDVAEKEECCG